MHNGSGITRESDKGSLSERGKGGRAWFRKIADKGLPRWISGLTETKGLQWLMIVAGALVVAFIVAPKSFREYHLIVGEPAVETIISPFTFQVIDEAATNKHRDEALRSVLPVYDFDDEMVGDVQIRVDKAFSFMREYLAAEAAQRAVPFDLPGHVGSETGKKKAEQRPFQPLDEADQRTRFENLIGTTVSPSMFEVLRVTGFNTRVQAKLGSLVVPVLVRGVVQSRELVMREGKRGILLWTKSSQKYEPVKDLRTIFDLREAEYYVRTEDEASLGDTDLAHAIRRLGMDLININIVYNREKSAALRKEALDSVKKVFFQVSKGEPIVREGEPVNEGHLRKLEGMVSASPPYVQTMILAGLALMLILLLRLSFSFSDKYLNRSQYRTQDLLLFCLLLVGLIIVVRCFGSLAQLTERAGEGFTGRSIFFAAPVATGSMLTASMLDARMAFIFSALAAITTSLAVEGDIYLFCFYFLAGIVGLHGMRRITVRTSVLRVGLTVGVVNMISILAIKMAQGHLTGLPDLYECALGFGGGLLSGLLVLGLAPLLEPLGYTTNIRLLELANLNHPLLKKMAMEAPGTYHHSIMVGNIAEAAAEQIGANPLLARVGAYYHDIGKMDKTTKPSYFIENQLRGPNPHDKLEPSMSALILVAHVKHGVEKAREYRLGTQIIDIIKQHHGTNLIRYFFNKAVERSERNHHTVQEDKYHYPGPRPRSKEAALVMMADTAEAACRTLADPTPARIQKTVQTLITGLFSDGQLDQSTLTLKDLHAVTRSFVRALQGIYHARIEYPAEVKARDKSNGSIAGQQTDKDRGRPGRAEEQGGKVIRRLGL